jgi:hypothetical protein
LAKEYAMLPLLKIQNLFQHNKHIWFSKVEIKCLQLVLDAGRLPKNYAVMPFTMLLKTGIDVLMKHVTMGMKSKPDKEFQKLLVKESSQEKICGLLQNFGTLIIEKSMLKLLVEEV